MVLTWNNWYRVISRFERDRGWGEGEDYTLFEEEYNCDAKVVGPCRNDFGHIGPDKEDLRFEYNYGEDAEDYDIVMKREDFRNYERSPFFLPETTQQKKYSKTLTRLLTTTHKATTL